MNEWLFALAKLVFGLLLLAFVVPAMPAERPLFAGWVGMIGCVFVLHFGVFHLLSCWWRSQGYAAAPLMDWPIASQSVAEFWGRRWNRAFRDLTHRLLFRPLETSCGSAAALFVSFLASGLVHDLVISAPATGGYGGPTCYFLLQAVGIASERSTLGRRLGLRRGLSGRLFAAFVIVGPLPLLFHEAFVLRVFVPFLHALGALP